MRTQEVSNPAIPFITVEQDKELEIPREVIGDIPVGTNFTIQPMIFPENGTLPERRGFILMEDTGPFSF